MVLFWGKKWGIVILSPTCSTALCQPCVHMFCLLLLKLLSGEKKMFSLNVYVASLIVWFHHFISKNKVARITVKYWKRKCLHIFIRHKNNSTNKKLFKTIYIDLVQFFINTVTVCPFLKDKNHNLINKAGVMFVYLCSKSTKLHNLHQNW